MNAECILCRTVETDVQFAVSWDRLMHESRVTARLI
eukprot:SAG25_NODE_5579_length_642_cov_0.762431_1_plen_35_part_10